MITIRQYRRAIIICLAISDVDNGASTSAVSTDNPPLAMRAVVLRRKFFHNINIIIKVIGWLLVLGGACNDDRLAIGGGKHYCIIPPNRLAFSSSIRCQFVAYQSTFQLLYFSSSPHARTYRLPPDRKPFQHPQRP